MRQFFHGMSLPFHLARALLADPVAGKLYLRVGLLQTVAALSLAFLFIGTCHEAAEEAREQDRQEAAEDPAEEIRELAAAAATRHLAEAEAEAARRMLEAGAAPRERRRAPRAMPPGTESADAGVPPGRARDEARARLDQRIRELEAAAQGQDAGMSFAEAISALAIEASTLSDDAEDADAEGDPDADTEVAQDATEDGGTAVSGTVPPSRGDDGTPRREPRVTSKVRDAFWPVSGWSMAALATLAFWATLFTLLQVAQWVVIALSHEYHDAIAREASLLTGVEPEDDEVQPRVRLDIPWIRKKVKRRWRALMLFAVGVPAMFVLTLPLLCLCNGTAFSVLSTAWGAWWLTVFTAAKSGHAWEAPAHPHTPWFLRAWTWLTTRMPGLRWGMLQRYGRFWTRRTQEVLAPVATVERHPWAFAGLTVVRFIGTFPPMKFFLRPLIPVASAHLLAAEVAARAAAIPPPQKPAIPAGETGA
jgi:hypothetical protein